MKVSDLAFRLWKLFERRRDTYSVKDLTRELGTSKTGLTKAILELQDAGVIVAEEV